MGTTEALAPEINGAEIAGDMQLGLIKRAMEVSHVSGQLVCLDIVTDDIREGVARGSRNPTEQYVHRLIDTAMGSYVTFQLYVSKSPEELLEVVKYKSESSQTDGLVVPIPLRTLRESGLDEQEIEERTLEIKRAISPGVDVDGNNPESYYLSTTSEAVLHYIETIDPEYREKVIALRGLGDRVNRPLQGILLGRGVDVRGIDKDSNQADVHRDLNDADIIVSATGGKGHTFTEADFKENTHPKVVIDVGKGKHPSEEKSVGDVAPSLRLWGRERGWGFTSPSNGVGLFVGLTIVARTIANAERVRDRRAAKRTSDVDPILIHLGGQQYKQHRY